MGKELLLCNVNVFLVITCDEPEVPTGSYVVGYDFNVHSSIEYHCEVGHILRGEAIHTCTRDGEWSGSTPACECRYFNNNNNSWPLHNDFDFIRLCCIRILCLLTFIYLCIVSIILLYMFFMRSTSYLF